MASNDPGDFHVDQFLTDMLVGYRPKGMIAEQLAPVVRVQKQSGLYAKVDRGNWFRRPTTLRAPGTGARQVRYTVSSDTYFSPNYELGTVVPWEVMDNADAPHDPGQRAGEFLIDQLMLDYELRVASKVWTGVGSSIALTGSAAWSDYAGSDPLTQIEGGGEAIRSSTGEWPNTAVCPWRLWLKLRRHPDIVRAIYPGAGVGGVANPAQFAELIGVDRVLIPRAITITSPEGTPEASNTYVDVWSTSFVLANIASNPGIMVPSFITSFRWGGPNIGQNGPGSFSIERRRNGGIKSDELQTGYYQDEKVQAPELGFLIATGV